MEFRDLKKQYTVLKKELDQAMLQVAASGAYINGPAVVQLEKALAEYVGVDYCISCANGTDALSIALKVWGTGPGDAVFVPDFTFFSSAETISGEGASPVFVDVDQRTYNIDCKDLERKIAAVLSEGTLKPKAIIGVDLFGLPASWPELRRIADKYGLLLLEDGAQGFGGTIAVNNVSKRACSFGDISTTSFFPAKPLGCYGDGGAIFTDNREWAALANSIKVHGKGSFKYDNVRLGMNSRLDTLQAAILLVKFCAFVENELESINNAAFTYSQQLAELLQDGNNSIKLLPFVPSGFGSSWAQYTIQLADRSLRDSLQAFLKSKGIPSMVYYPTGMHDQTAFKGLKSYGPCPVTEKLCNTVLSLPIHPYIENNEISLVVDSIKEWLYINK